MRVWKPWAPVPGQGEISHGSSGKTLSLCHENRHHSPCWICCCFCFDLIVVVFVILIKAWGVFGYKGLCENEEYFGGWGWATFFDFFLVPSVGQLNLILTGRQGEGGNKNQCVKPLVTNGWRTNIDKCKGLVVLLFCMSISNLSHKACLYFQEA